ncbi:MAG: 2-polyprenyl-3-methyl-6-methoxy-1,4-benzoquinone monooxygenase [Gammaproteobacteria bacterium]|nr:2-polyprenyl-3-methyl-6-methoxy-1,4-benzoquinone monooxygenase [Gammaproteobacteria bacterium]
MSQHTAPSRPSRHYTPIDQLLLGVDTGLRTLFGQPAITERPNPSRAVAEGKLSDSERQLAGRLMRINHAGEVAAQGLYQGQALTAKLPQVRQQMERAAQEENDHLDWCERRAKILGTHVSHLNPAWYVGSLAIGALAGLTGDKWSLGFVAETEKQVVRHLDEHLAQLPEHDTKSRAILEQMKTDEGRHATVAIEAGGTELPYPVKKLMGLMSTVMTRTAFWV